MLTYKQEDEPSASEDVRDSSNETKPPPSDDATVSTSEVPAPTVPSSRSLETDDLLGLRTSTADASAIEESNALAFAIVPSGTTPFDSDPAQPKAFDPTGWELALVTSPSSNLSAAQERQLVGGLDSLALDSFYDEAAYRASHQPVYGAPAPNPFEVADPLVMSNTTALPPSVQMVQYLSIN